MAVGGLPQRACAAVCAALACQPQPPRSTRAHPIPVAIEKDADAPIAIARILRRHCQIRHSPNSPIRFMTATSWSPPAAASACIARKSTSLACSQVKNSVLGKSTTALGSSGSCSTISVTSILSREPCNHSTTRSARGCHPCLRYVPLPMSPGRTKLSPGWGARIRTWEWRNQNPLPYHLATPHCAVGLPVAPRARRPAAP